MGFQIRKNPTLNKILMTATTFGLLNFVWELVQLPFYTLWVQGTLGGFAFADLGPEEIALSMSQGLDMNQGWPCSAGQEGQPRSEMASALQSRHWLLFLYLS